jgi:hypothetical protein
MSPGSRTVPGLPCTTRDVVRPAGTPLDADCTPYILGRVLVDRAPTATSALGAAGSRLAAVLREASERGDRAVSPPEEPGEGLWDVGLSDVDRCDMAVAAEGAGWRFAVDATGAAAR